MEGTAAILDAPDNAAPPEATDELALVPDSAEGQAATEAVGDGEPTDSDATPANPWEGLTPEEIAAKWAEQSKALEETIRKDAKARADESVRQQTERMQREATERAQREQAVANAQRADAVRQGWAANVLAQLTRQAAKSAIDAGRDDAPLDPRQVQQVAAELNAAQFHDAHQELAQHAWAAVTRLDPAYRPSAELAQRAAAANNAYDRAGMIGALVDMLAEAQRPRIRAEEQAALQAKAKTAQETANLRTATAKREPSPTGGPAASGTSPLDYTSAELEAMPTAVWTGFTKEQKDQIYARVAANDEKHGAETVRAAVRARW